MAAPSATAIEDYVKVIYAHTEWQPAPISSRELATRLGLAASSVTEMVKKLVAQGLVEHEPYGAITLTVDGTALALRMLRRHRLIESWLVSECGYGWHEVHDEAEVLEHAMSDRLLDTIDARLGFPARDPHGDPIPNADGVIAVPRAVLLGSLMAGDAVRVVRVSDRDPALLERLEARGIALDVELAVAAVEPFSVSLGGAEAAWNPAADALEAIWVTRPVASA